MASPLPTPPRYACNQSTGGGSRDRWVPGAHKPAHLACLTCFRPVKNPNSKNQQTVPEDSTPPLVCTCMHANTHTYAHMHA